MFFFKAKFLDMNRLERLYSVHLVGRSAGREGKNKVRSVHGLGGGKYSIPPESRT